MKNGEYNMQYNRNELLTSLRQNVVEVRFTKANGEQRMMRCTLMKNMLPESYSKNTEEQEVEKKYHQDHPDLIRAWDLGVNGWRSFRMDTVEYVNTSDNH